MCNNSLQWYKWQPIAKKQYRTISLPQELYITIEEAIEEAIKNENGDYVPTSEFVKDVVRTRLRELGYKI